MATATLERKATEPGRTFKVTKGQVGPWPLGHAFAEREFQRLNPLPTSDLAKATIDLDTYHNDLLERLVALGVIVNSPDAKPSPTPLGPESSPPTNRVTPGNPAIMEAVRVELERREQAAKLSTIVVGDANPKK